MTNILKSVKISVLAHSHGNEVLPALQDAMETGKPFDLCVSDIQMSEMNGYDVARKVREWEKSKAEKIKNDGG
ncbi:MAG: response regulator [Deltaproteobacteria bacterium]|nr:response regulator [Deltaproteobacteria bacterium]